MAAPRGIETPEPVSGDPGDDATVIARSLDDPEQFAVVFRRHAPDIQRYVVRRHGSTVYVANSSSGTVTPIRTATNTALPAIKTGDGPKAIAITPDGKTAYVVSDGDGGRSGWVTPICTATNTALRPIKLTGSPTAILITHQRAPGPGGVASVADARCAKGV